MNKITPYPHQLRITDEAMPILKDNMIVYLSMQERTGKSLIGVLLAEDTLCNRVLVVTKKKAMGRPHVDEEGWEDLLNNYIHLSSYKVINYQSLHKLNPDDYDIIIVDEAHAFVSSYPKTSTTWKTVRKFTKDKPLIYMSATPKAQGSQLLFHQLKLSDWSPWAKYKNFYAWYEDYALRDKNGNFKVKYIGPSRTAIDYTAIDHDKVWNDVKHLFITYTRAELGFEHEPNDILHFIDLDEGSTAVYNALLKDQAIEFTHAETGKDYTLVCDSSIKLRWTLHMIEGGGLKYTPIVTKEQAKLIEQGKAKKPPPEYLVLGNREKVDYILKVWGDTDDVAIMFQYKSDLKKLERHFKHAKLLQATSYAEGVDLSDKKHLVIYSQDFSTSKHSQRRARQANMKREEEINVHFLLVKKAVSEQVYNTVSTNQTNFVDDVFIREEI